MVTLQPRRFVCSHRWPVIRPEGVMCRRCGQPWSPSPSIVTGEEYFGAHDANAGRFDDLSSLDDEIKRRTKGVGAYRAPCRRCGSMVTTTAALDVECDRCKEKRPVSVDRMRQSMASLELVLRERALVGTFVRCPGCGIEFPFEKGDPLDCKCPDCRSYGDPEPEPPPAPIPDVPEVWVSNLLAQWFYTLLFLFVRPTKKRYLFVPMGMWPADFSRIKQYGPRRESYSGGIRATTTPVSPFEAAGVEPEQRRSPTFEMRDLAQAMIRTHEKEHGRLVAEARCDPPAPTPTPGPGRKVLK